MSGGRRASWRDAADRAVTAPAPPGEDMAPFYAAIGDFQGADYRRNAFTRGTEEELRTLLAALSPPHAASVLDVGCGDARHLRALTEIRPDVHGVGVDVSGALLAAAARAVAGHRVELLRGDARRLTDVLGARTGTFDVVWSLCQGALGTSPASDPSVLAGMARALRPGGTAAMTFFHALFAARHLVPGDAFDTVGMVHHQRTEVRGPDHARRSFDLWTASYTVREAVDLVESRGLDVTSVRGVEPGRYGWRAEGEVGLDDPEVLVLARRAG